MRAFFLGLVVLLVFLPALLIMFAPRKPLPMRLGWGLLAFFLPIVTFGLVQFIPTLANSAPEATHWGRLVGLLVVGAGLILPWVIFALFLHRRR